MVRGESGADGADGADGVGAVVGGSLTLLTFSATFSMGSGASSGSSTMMVRGFRGAESRDPLGRPRPLFFRFFGILEQFLRIVSNCC